jgi:hypothetical protein
MIKGMGMRGGGRGGGKAHTGQGAERTEHIKG